MTISLHDNEVHLINECFSHGELFSESQSLQSEGHSNQSQKHTRLRLLYDRVPRTPVEIDLFDAVSRILFGCEEWGLAGSVPADDLVLLFVEELF